ncbi:hypothetical protein P170DRAFT_438604 [Aspergillus steynii IBT 23096]|uniref:Chromosome segregation ATPase family protein n=1 Tax=Aspergillus steynii IBT 23096 TaxID=1392250 RepID=A0A2I2G202_9EURO|nr:uncharacterized protein P170DRAFT_438604 [Aspergillus steynii IBT 23096]PLB46905.1 hypothetical protein P170DRAFT_438604 [Aspergillus steynii IBT 23096]
MDYFRLTFKPRKRRWDSSDPERAPPPLPMNPGSTSPATKGNVSPGIQAVAANFAEKMRENAPSSYTTNPMPPKPSSPEKSLIKGQFHKRMQSFQNNDPRSEFLNYLESRSPERPLKASILDPNAKQQEKSPTKSSDDQEDRDSDRDLPNLLISNRYLSKPILGESTPPSATMLALQNMQLPSESEVQPKSDDSDPFVVSSETNPSSLNSLSTQIHSLTDIASNLQREMAQLSRRSKDNATDLVSLKAATNARDEDIRKSLRDLSSSLSAKFLDSDAATRWDFSTLLGSDKDINNRDPDSSPNSKKSYSAPRMQSPNPFAAAMEREMCGSPAPISDGSASIALLEKVLREMATKEGQDKLVELAEELKSRPTSDTSESHPDSKIAEMLEEILTHVKEDAGNKALVPTRLSFSAARMPPRANSDFTGTQSRSFDARPVFGPEGDEMDNHRESDRSLIHTDNQDDMLAIMKRVRSSVIEGGGLTNEVKALVRELRGEVLGMGRNLARQFEEAQMPRALEDQSNSSPGEEEIAAIVDDCLHELKEQLASILAENQHHSSALSEFRAAMDSSAIYSILKGAFEDLDWARLRDELRGNEMQKEDIIETVREAWETYKPEIELQNFGLERDEILECLAEGLKEYQPKHEHAVTYDQVLAAVQAGMQDFAPPPSITKDEIAQTIRECFENSQPAPRSVEPEHLHTIRDEILQAVTESVTTQSALTRETLDSGLGRDEILSAVSDGIEAHFTAAKEMETPHITKEDVANVVNDAFSAQQSAVSADAQPSISRDDILNAIAEGMENQNSMIREIELNKDDLMEAISAGLQEATASTNHNVGDQMLGRLQEQLEAMKEETHQRSLSNEQDNSQVLDAIKDGIAVVRQEVESYAAAATEASGKHEIMDTVKDGFRLLQADMEKTITETALSNGSGGNPDTPELLDAMEKEFEHLRTSLSGMLIRSNVSAEKDEILDAIRDISEGRKTESTQDVAQVIKQEFESLRESMNMSLVRAEEPKNDKDDIIAALRESLETFHTEKEPPKESGENVFSTNELVDVFQDGVGTIREDLAKLIDRPAASDHSELLETLKEGLSSLKADVESLRESHKGAEGTEGVEEMETTRGGELMLANESNIGTDIEGLKALISQLQVKVEAIESTPRAAEPSADALKKEHLDDVLAGLHELQGSISGIVARENPTDETTAKKEDTDAIETLLRNTKSQLDEMTFPAPDEIAKAEQLGSLEAMVKETKEAISEMGTRLEAEGPTKAEIGTLETLMKDMWVALEELKGKGTEEETDTEKLVKADLQTVEAMIFEVKTQVDELKLPDVETLPTKTDFQDLSALVAEFREKTEAENEMTAQGFEARKVEHAGLAEKIDEARAVVEGLGDEMKSKLDGSNEGLSELKQLLEGLAASAESFTTVENVNELTELINREFERARGEQDAEKLEKEERDAAAVVKHDETRAAIIVELGTKIDEKLGEVIGKYDEAQSAMESKFSDSAQRDEANLEAVTNTKALAEDIKLVIGTMGNSVNEACERISADTKTFFEKVDTSYTKMEEIQNEVKSQQEQARSDIEKAAAATDRVESKLHEFHPQVLESIQEILSIVGQHYDHSQKSAEDLKMDLSTLPSTIPQLLPALPAPEPEKYDDSQVHEKLNSILDHAKNEKVHEALDVLVERVTNDQVHEKLDQLLNQTTSTNGQMYDKLNELLSHATGTNGPVHDKLDTLIGHATNTEQSVTQMMKLDEMHKDIMETSRKMNEMFTAQSAMVTEDNERRRKESEEAAVALERRNAQKDQVEAEIVTLNEEKESLLKMISSLKTEKDDLVKQNTKLNKEVSGLEMALELRQEEMQVMEDRADSLEKRILEGVLDHARSVLLSRPNMPGLNMKKSRGSRARGPSCASNASTAKDNRSILGSSVGLALKKRGQTPSQAGSVTPSNASKERRILSLSHVTGNRGVSDRQASGNSGFASLKRSHSVKSNFSQRKASWGGRSSVANKENEAFPEEEEHQSGEESDTGTERRTSYTGTYTDSMVYGTGSVVSTDRRVSTASSTPGGAGAEQQDTPGDREQDENDGPGAEAQDDDDAETTKGDDPSNDRDAGDLDAEAAKMVLYGQHSDSGLGPEITSAVG